MVGMSRPSAQAARSMRDRFQGLPFVSIASNGLASSGRKLALDQHLVAAKIHDLVHVADQHRTELLARTACRAAPEHVRLHHVLHQVDLARTSAEGSESDSPGIGFS